MSLAVNYDTIERKLEDGKVFHYFEGSLFTGRAVRVTDDKGLITTTHYNIVDGLLHSEDDLPDVLETSKKCDLNYTRYHQEWHKHGISHRIGGPSYVDGWKDANYFMHFEIWQVDGKHYRDNGLPDTMSYSSCRSISTWHYEDGRVKRETDFINDSPEEQRSYLPRVTDTEKIYDEKGALVEHYERYRHEIVGKSYIYYDPNKNQWFRYVGLEQERATPSRDHSKRW